jgi:hypothetical protein
MMPNIPFYSYSSIIYFYYLIPIIDIYPYLVILSTYNNSFVKNLELFHIFFVVEFFIFVMKILAFVIVVYLYFISIVIVNMCYYCLDCWNLIFWYHFNLHIFFTIIFNNLLGFLTTYIYFSSYLLIIYNPK